MLKDTKYGVYWKQREGITLHSSGSSHTSRKEEATALYELLKGAKVNEGYLTDYAEDTYSKMSLHPNETNKRAETYSIELWNNIWERNK